MSSPAASIISLAVASAVDPKASSGTVSRTTVGEEVSAEKFSACSLDSMIRRNSRPPAPLAAAEGMKNGSPAVACIDSSGRAADDRSEEHTSELQSRGHLVCRLLLDTKEP